MGKIQAVEPAQLIVGVLAAPSVSLAEVEGELVARWGPVALASEEWDFTWTDYYEAEMGPALRRKFWALERPIDPADLSGIKRATNDLEQTLAGAGAGGPARSVNLDPGYVTLGQLVLATTKPHQHRIYLGQGIYAEVTLRFQRGAFAPWPWTYPDYRSPAYLDFFNRVREFHRQQIKGR
jgi:hypothetical protein